MIEPHENEPLSPQGQARRDDMLGELTGHMRKVHRRRRRVRVATSSTLVSGLILVVMLRLFLFDPPVPEFAGKTPQNDKQLADRPAPVIVWVQTDPGVFARMNAAPNPMVERMNDAQLIQTLVQIGRPAGLIRFGDRLALSAPVTDEELSSGRTPF